MNIIYNSPARTCVELGGVVVHVERADNFAEARIPGTGGPRSGTVVGRREGGEWTVEPVSENVRNLVMAAIAAA
ncbi:hypothetical protein D3C71_324180 [compost metagenome]